MGRTRTFDRDSVLMAAANVFRQRGYRDVSIRELEEATGLVSGSIYNAFGDKAGLFRAALETYVHLFVRQRLADFASDTARLEDLEKLYLSVLEPPLSDGFGCLVTNSIVEFGGGDDLAGAEIARTLDMVKAAIGKVLKRELASAATPASTMQLVILYHGILTLSRSGMPFADMRKAVRAAFDDLKSRRDIQRR